MRINVFKSGGNSAEGGFVSNGLTLQGPLILSGPHTDHLHAVPKQYVDNATYNLDANNITSGVLAAARLPAFTGDATTILGTSNLILANTGVTPGSIIKPTVDAKGRVVSGGTITEADITAISFDKVTTGRPTTLNGYGITDGVPLSSNTTITGDLIQSADPVMADQVATKHYVDAASGLAGGISVGDIIRKPYTTTPAGFLKCNGGEVDKTTYANLYSVIGDTFLGSSTPGAGKPWEQQYEFNKIQDVDLLGWRADTSLPSVLTHFSHIVTKNRVYVLGGWTGTTSSATVYTAPIDSSGTIGTWVTGTNLPIAIHGGQAVVAKNRVYLIGGYANGTTPVSTVYSAPIDASGLIGSWVTCPSLPSNLLWSRALIIKNRIYMFGGQNGSVSISTIYTTIINDDGTLNSWSIYGALPYAAHAMVVFITKNRVYVLGGNNGTVGFATSCTAIINADGTLGSWEYAVSLPKSITVGPVIVTNNCVYIIYGTEVWSSKINSDGTLRGWVNTATVPYSMGDTKAVVTNSKIYLISSTGNGYVGNVYYTNFLGGSNDYSSFYNGSSDSVINNNYLMPGSGRPWQQQYQINSTQSTDISNWTATTSLPVALSVFQAFVTKNRVYLLGGYNGTTVLSTVYTAPINSDGTLGTWVTDTNTLPISTHAGIVIVTKNYVFHIGGANTSGNAHYFVYRAAINADGTIGTWLTDGSLPGPLSNSTAFVTKNRVYVCCGTSSNSTVWTNAVYTAPINNDGSLGVWTTDTSMPTILADSNAVLTKNRVYLVGGYNGTNYVSTVYTATINPDGYIGTWTVAPSLPIATGWSQVFVTKNKVYIFGGYGTNTLNNVYIAVINEDGTLGPWVAGTSLPVATTQAQLIATKNRVYLLGGGTGNTSYSTVYTASILEGLNDYSPYYDGTFTTPDTTVNYMMPGSGRPWEQQYQINETQTSILGSWTNTGTIPAPAFAGIIVTTKNRVYICGGWNGTSLTSTVYTAPINADGTLGTWTTDNPLPVNLYSTQVIVAKNRVYILGGNIVYGFGGAINTIYTAAINADGTLGTWTTANNTLPVGVHITQALLVRNKIYVIGGYNGTNPISTVYVSDINSDGTLSAWSTSGSLPGPVCSHRAFMTKNRIYVFGGWNGAIYTNANMNVYTTTINSDGTLAPWVVSGTFPVAIAEMQILVTNNRVYVFGGWGNGYATSAVYTASISIDGTLGTWVVGNSLSVALRGSLLITTNSKVYLLNGVNGSDVAVNTIYSTNYSGGLNDYSPYYDGTIEPVSLISTKFRLPDYTSLDKEFGEYVTSYIKY